MAAAGRHEGEGEGPGPSLDQGQAPRGRARAWLRGVAITLALLLVLVLGAISVVLWVPPASRALVELALARWDARIPGALGWNSIEGSLAGGLEVEGLAITDADARPLVLVERLHVRLHPLSLLADSLRAEPAGLGAEPAGLGAGRATIRATATGVDLWTDHGWADLGGPETPAPPPGQPLGPELPLEISAELTVAGAQVWSEAGRVAALERLRVRGRGVEREAVAQVELRGLTLVDLLAGADETEAAVGDLEVAALDLRAGWDAPVLTIAELRLRSPLVDIPAAEARYDLAAARGQLELDGEARLAALGERFGLPLELREGLGDHAQIHVEARGGPSEFEAWVDLGVGAAGQLRVHVRAEPRVDADPSAASPDQRPWAEARISGRVGAGLIPKLELGSLRVEARVRVEGPADGDLLGDGLEASLAATIHERRSSARIYLDANARLDAWRGPGPAGATRVPAFGRAQVHLRGAGITATGELEALEVAPGEAAELRATAELEASLARVGRILASVLDRPQLDSLRGRLGAEGRCGNEAEARAETTNETGAGAADETETGAETPAGAGGRADPPRETSELAGLSCTVELAVRDLGVDLGGDPGAELDADGGGDPDVTRLELDALTVEARLGPGLGPKLGLGPPDGPGRGLLPLPVAASARAEGLRLSEPELTLERVELELDGTSERLAVRADARGPHEQLAAAATVRIGEAIDVDLRELSLRSDRVGPGARLRLERPTQVHLGEGFVELDALELALAGGRVAVDGRLAYAPGLASELVVELEAVPLARLDPWLPGPSLAGRLAGVATLEGTLERPRAQLELEVRGLAVAGLALGRLGVHASLGAELDPSRVAADSRARGGWLAVAPALGLDSAAIGPAQLGPPEPGQLRVRADLDGPIAERLTLAAAIPLAAELGLPCGEDRPLRVRLTAARVDLAELGRWMPVRPRGWVPPPGSLGSQLELRGLGDLDLLVTGTRAQPRLEALARVRRLAIDRAGLGSLAIRAGYADQRGSLELDAALGFAQLELRGQVPLAVDLAADPAEPLDEAARVAWLPERPHQAALELRRLDLDALAQALAPRLPALADALAETELEGTFSASARLRGSADEPSFAAIVRGEGLGVRGLELGRLRVFVDHEPGSLTAELWLGEPAGAGDPIRLDARLELPVELEPAVARREPEAGGRGPGGEPGRWPARVRLRPEQRLAGQVRVMDLPLARVSEAFGSSLGWAGELDGSLALTGTLGDPRVDVRARIDSLARAGDPVGDLVLRLGYAEGRARADADLIRAGAPVLTAGIEAPITVDLAPTLSGSELAWDRGGHHRLFAVGRGIDEPLLAALLAPAEPGAEETFGPAPFVGGPRVGPGERRSELSFDLAGGGAVDDFAVHGTARARVEVGDRRAMSVDVHLDLDEATQAVDLALRPAAGAPMVASLVTEVAVPRALAGEQELAAVPFALRFDAPGFELSSLVGLLPAGIVDPEGILGGRIHGRGRLGAPHLGGRISVRDGAITVVPLRQRLTELELDLDFEGERVDLRRLSLAAGRGGLVADGSAELRGAGEVEGELSVTLTEVPLIRPGLPAMVLDAGVDIDAWREPGTTRVAVRLREPEVTVAGTTEDTPEPIPTSDDVVFVGGSADRRRMPALGRAARDPIPELAIAPEPTPERVIMTFDLEQPLLITGTSIDMRWDGSLELVAASGEVSVGGQLEASRGILRLFGNRFELRRGIVTLPPVEAGAGETASEIDPFLDLEAGASLAEAEVTVTVRGRLSRPTLEFTSNPPLSEYQILTLLVTGSPEVGGAEGDVAAKAASLLAAVSNPQLQQQLSRVLGIDRATISFGETIDQPILTVGKRITRSIYVETTYHHNAPVDQNTTQVAVEYGIRSRWIVESFFGDAAVGGFGVYWTRSFPAPAWTEGFDMPDLQLPELKFDG